MPGRTDCQEQAGGTPVERGIADDIPDRRGGTDKNRNGGIERRLVPTFWSLLEWTEVGAGFGRAQEVEITEDSVSNCCGQVLKGFLTVHRVLLLRIMPAVPNRLRLS